MRYLVTVPLAILMASGVFAQESAPFFRFGGNIAVLGGGGETVDPDVDEDEDDDDVDPTDPEISASLAYEPQSTELSRGVTAEPIYPDGLDTYGFEFVDYWPDANIDQDTGVIEWLPATASGRLMAVVRMYINEDRTEYVTGTFDLEVDSGVEITVNPKQAAFQQGEGGRRFEFEASISPEQSEEGYWGIMPSDGDLVVELPENQRAYIDLDEINESGRTMPAGDQWFQFSRIEPSTWTTVYSEPVKLTIEPAPAISWSGSTTNYRVSKGNVIQIRPNSPISLAPAYLNGAVGVDSTPPSWVDVEGSLPPGLSLSATGAISGTTSAADGSLFTATRAVVGDNGAYGETQITFMVRSSFVDPNVDADGDGFPAVRDPDDNDPKVPFDPDAVPHSLRFYQPWSTCSTERGHIETVTGINSIEEAQAFVSARNGGAGYDVEGTPLVCVFNELEWREVAQWGGNADADGFPADWGGKPKIITFQFCRHGHIYPEGEDCFEWGGWERDSGYIYPGSACNLNNMNSYWEWHGGRDSPPLLGEAGLPGYYQLELYPDQAMPTFLPADATWIPIDGCGFRFYTP